MVSINVIVKKGSGQACHDDAHGKTAFNQLAWIGKRCYLHQVRIVSVEGETTKVLDPAAPLDNHPLDYLQEQEKFSYRPCQILETNDSRS